MQNVADVDQEDPAKNKVEDLTNTVQMLRADVREIKQILCSLLVDRSGSQYIASNDKSLDNSANSYEEAGSSPLQALSCISKVENTPCSVDARQHVSSLAVASLSMLPMLEHVAEESESLTPLGKVFSAKAAGLPQTSNCFLPSSRMSHGAELKLCAAPEWDIVDLSQSLEDTEPFCSTARATGVRTPQRGVLSPQPVNSRLSSVMTSPQAHNKMLPLAATPPQRGISGRCNIFGSSQSETEGGETDGASAECKCEFCGKTVLGGYGALARHRHDHRADAQFHCRICGNVLLSFRNLEMHYRAHATALTFRCPLCAAAFPQRGQLYAHMREEHTRGVLHRCSVCLKVFGSGQKLQRHARSMHTKKR
ncbi:PREDICTED: sal-like protein 1 [Priapulus caudatus]|uniref:Sal-like protein 1 n=1 Tax=Priapulus caudatus TaxID=37621 RepID=A0ABM1ENB9_PRICU|nr:PREDICTED: sal-like protein 1 [Priapulus caudatus]